LFKPAKGYKSRAEELNETIKRINKNPKKPENRYHTEDACFLDKNGYEMRVWFICGEDFEWDTKEKLDKITKIFAYKTDDGHYSTGEKRIQFHYQKANICKIFIEIEKEKSVETQTFEIKQKQLLSGDSTDFENLCSEIIEILK
jgi:hypothetical protein